MLACSYVYVTTMVREEEVKDLGCGYLHGRIGEKREKNRVFIFN